ncbi:MAG: hypothetical protein JNJ55_01490 [Betaproteobacteria bacterium]|nr:hypothetical protein [Betaproteobacteria bacterium]
MNARVSKISKALLDISQCADVVLRVSNSGVIALRGKGISNSERCLMGRIDGFRSLEQILSISGDVIGLHATMGKLLALGMVVLEGDAEPQIAATPAPAQASPPPQPAKPAMVKTAPTPAPAAQQPKATAKPTAPSAAKPAAPAASAKPVAAPPAPKSIPVLQKPPVPSASAKPAPVAVPKAQGAQSELAQAKALLRVEAGYLFNGDKANKVVARIDACKNTEEIFDLIVKLQGLLAKTGKVNPDVFLERLTSGLAKIREAQKNAPAAQRAA